MLFFSLIRKIRIDVFFYFFLFKVRLFFSKQSTIFLSSLFTQIGKNVENIAIIIIINYFSWEIKKKFFFFFYCTFFGPRIF